MIWLKKAVEAAQLWLISGTKLKVIEHSTNIEATGAEKK